jgi:hypothetical protein
MLQRHLQGSQLYCPVLQPQRATVPTKKDVCIVLLGIILVFKIEVFGYIGEVMGVEIAYGTGVVARGRKSPKDFCKPHQAIFSEMNNPFRYLPNPVWQVLLKKWGEHLACAKILSDAGGSWKSRTLHGVLFTEESSI